MIKEAQILDALLARKRALDSPACRTAGFAASLARLRNWQAARLARTYQDLRDDPRYGPALAFFLSDLYGPQEFPRHDRDLRRALTRLKRALPATLLKVLAQAIELDVLTLELDHAMVRALGVAPVSDATYAAAYRSASDKGSRIRQIDLIVGIGEGLARVIRKVWVGPLLHAAHTPAHAAGFGALQDFLERGHAAFHQMQDVGGLLQAIRERETEFMYLMLAEEAVHE